MTEIRGNIQELLDKTSSQNRENWGIPNRQTKHFERIISQICLSHQT